MFYYKLLRLKRRKMPNPHQNRCKIQQIRSKRQRKNRHLRIYRMRSRLRKPIQNKPHCLKIRKNVSENSKKNQRLKKRFQKPLQILPPQSKKRSQLPQNRIQSKIRSLLLQRLTRNQLPQILIRNPEPQNRLQWQKPCRHPWKLSPQNNHQSQKTKVKSRWAKMPNANSNANQQINNASQLRKSSSRRRMS